MNDVFLFTGYDRIDLLEFFLAKKIKIHALIIPSLDKYINTMTEAILYCSKHSIPIMSSKSISSFFDQQLVSNSVLYSSGYPLMIKPAQFKRFRYAINCHPSLLPKYRGKYLEYIFLNKDVYSGTTLHHIDEGCDSGPIILQSSFEVRFTDTVSSLLKKSYDKEILLLDKLVNNPDLILNSIPQDESKATTYITKRTPQDSRVNHMISLLDAFLMSRAFDSDRYPGFFVYNGYKITFTMTADRLACEDDGDFYPD